jgi:hypothetical protein
MKITKMNNKNNIEENRMEKVSVIILLSSFHLLTNI